MRRLICAFVVRIWHKTCFLMARLTYNLNETLIQTLKFPCLQRTQGNCRYCCENKGCKLSAKFSCCFFFFSLNSVHNGNLIDNSIHHGYCMKEFPSTCTTMKVRFRGKKQNLEEITHFCELEWNFWRLIAREIILSFNKFILLLQCL